MKNKFKKDTLAKNTLSKSALLEHIVKGNSRVVRGIDTHDFLLEQLLGRTKEKEIRRGEFVPIYTGGKPIQASEIQRQIEIFEKKKINDSI